MKKEKKTPGDIILYMCNITGCTVPEIWSTTDRIFFILDSFLPFYPTNPKKQNFQKMRKTTRNIIILHKSTKNHDHMPHHSWDATRDGCNFYFSFCASFCPLPPCTHSPWSSCENSEKQVLKKRTVIILQPVLVPRWINLREQNFLQNLPCHLSSLVLNRIKVQVQLMNCWRKDGISDMILSNLVIISSNLGSN